MSKIPDYVSSAINRICDFLPEPVKVMELPLAIKKKLPFGISYAYDYYMTEIYDTSFIIAGVGDDEVVTPSILEKQKMVIIKQTGLVPIFVFQKLVSYLFSRYAKKNIDVIVGNKQLFLPSIFLIVDKDKYELTNSTEKVPITFQLIVLYHLEKENIEGVTTHALTEKLRTSYSTVNRAVRWMKENGFISLVGSKEKRIQFNKTGKELWKNALPYLCSPIDFIAYTSEIGISENGLISEQNALAEYSLSGGGPYRIAVSREEFNKIKSRNINWDKFGEAGIEVWKYDPTLLSDSGVVDKLSLYLLLKDYEDERVQIELENMINNILW